MNIEVDGSRVEAAQVGFREMGFGQQVADRPMLDLQLAIDPATARRLLGPVYQSLVDAVRSEPDMAPAIERLARLRFPPFTELMAQDPDLLSELLMRWVPLETLGALLPLPHDRARYAINTIRALLWGPGGMTMRAEAFAIP